jgi:acetyl-CoA synthase
MANEVKEFASAVIKEAPKLVSKASGKLQAAIKKKGAEGPVCCTPSDYLPVIYGITGKKISILSDLNQIIVQARDLLAEPPGNNHWLPYLGHALDAGIASLFAEEIIEAVDINPDSNSSDGLWLGAPSDDIVQTCGLQIINGAMKGFATLIGAAPSTDKAKQIAQELKEKELYIFLVGQDKEESMGRQLRQAGINLGWDEHIIPFGRQTSSIVHVFGFLTRIAIIHGKIKPGDLKGIYAFLKEKVFGFFMILDQVDNEKYAMAAAANSFGFLTMAQEYVPQLLPIHTLHRLR